MLFTHLRRIAPTDEYKLLHAKAMAGTITALENERLDHIIHHGNCWVWWMYAPAALLYKVGQLLRVWK